MKEAESPNGVLLSNGEQRLYFDTKSFSLLDVHPAFDEHLPDALIELERIAKSTSAYVKPPAVDRPALRPILRRSPPRPEGRSTLGRLTLNVSNTCNLRCAYCYADFGHYHKARDRMEVGRARQIVNSIVSRYNPIRTVHFFGGEPLLNCRTIEAICLEFVSLFEAGRISTMPSFVATTNGTLSGNEVIALLKKWNIALTVSWDGPEAVQNTARPALNGVSSYAQVEASIERFRINNVPFEIECTYNINHQRAGVSVLDLLEFFYQKTGLEVIHIAPAYTPLDCGSGPGNQQTASEASMLIGNPQLIFQGDQLKSAVGQGVESSALINAYLPAVRQSVINLLTGEGPVLEFAYRIVKQILTKSPSTLYCPAFFNQLSVSHMGDAYPCFMFMGDNAFRLGNVLDEGFPDSEAKIIVRRYLDDFGPGIAGRSNNRWFAPLLSGCIAGEYIQSGRMNGLGGADFQEAMILECLPILARAGHIAAQNLHDPLVERVN